MNQIPVIETERLILRSHRLDDFAECAAMWGDAKVTRFIGGKPSTAQQSWIKMLTYIGHWSLLNYGYWAVEEKLSEKFIGEIGFADFKRQVDESVKDELGNQIPELGFAFASEFHGKGYATEAVNAVIKWADSQPKFNRTVCFVQNENSSSIRVVEKCGYKKMKEFSFNDIPSSLYLREMI